MTTLVLGTPPPELEALCARRRQAGVDAVLLVDRSSRRSPGCCCETARTGRPRAAS